MMVVGLLFLIGGTGVLLTMNRLLWPLTEGDAAGSPGAPGRMPVAGGRPGPARHPRGRAVASAGRRAPARERAQHPPASSRSREAPRAQPTVPAPPPVHARPTAPAPPTVQAPPSGRHARPDQGQPASRGGGARARLRVVTVPDRQPARTAAAPPPGRVYGGARRAG
ncbi:hypothetical protein [Asanoa sp. NPDC050611]|uniref:hypothetical protein n=1 Tax=Asanoa sp. NPDC050611 TaxID=3157098 RepID=UPI0033F8DAF3